MNDLYGFKIELVIHPFPKVGSSLVVFVNSIEIVGCLDEEPNLEFD